MFINKERGLVFLEVNMVVALIAVVAMLAVLILGVGVGNRFCYTGGKLQQIDGANYVYNKELRKCAPDYGGME